MANLEELQLRLGYTFRDTELMRLALTHPSICQESGLTLAHNQRLEFLGDSVLELVLSAELFKRFPSMDEGPLTKARAELVNRRALAEYARKLQVGQYLILSRGEDKNGGRERSSTLADAFEALIGAIFLDGGFAAANDVVRHVFEDHFADFQSIPSIDNPKGELQEILQAASAEPPKYILHSVSGPDHDREFECAVMHAGQELGRGQGKSKKQAETAAALAALAHIKSPKKTDPSAGQENGQCRCDLPEQQQPQDPPEAAQAGAEAP